MKNFFTVQVTLLLSCICIAAYSGLAGGEVHRIIVQEEYRRPKRHKERHRRPHKHQHHRHHFRGDDDRDFRSHKYEDDRSVEDFSGYYNRHEDGYGSRNVHKKRLSRKPFHSNQFDLNLEKGEKRHNPSFEFQHQEWVPMENLESSASNHYIPKFLNTDLTSFSTVETPLHGVTKKNIDPSRNATVVATIKPDVVARNTSYDNFSTTSKPAFSESYQRLRNHNKIDFNQEYHLLSPLFHFNQQLVSENNASNASKPSSTTRHTRVVIRRKNKSKKESV